VLIDSEFQTIGPATAERTAPMSWYHLTADDDWQSRDAGDQRCDSDIYIKVMHCAELL